MGTKSEFAKSMGRKLKLARVGCDLSRRKVAEEVAVSVEAIRTWESGERSPGAETLAKLAELYNVPVAYFFGEIDSDLDRARGQGFPAASDGVLAVAG